MLIADRDRVVQEPQFDVQTCRNSTSIEHLIASKRTGRLQDAADIEVLEEIRRLRRQSE